MKFGKDLLRSVAVSNPEWAPFWMNYKILKKKIKAIVDESRKKTTESSEIPEKQVSKQFTRTRAEVGFFRSLKDELKKTSKFFVEAESNFNTRLTRLAASLEHVHKCRVDQSYARGRPLKDLATRLMLACLYFYKDLLLLENFAIVNYCGFAKILKKHDRMTGLETRQRFMVNVVNKKPICSYPNTNRLFQEAELIFDALKTIYNGVKDSPPEPSKDLETSITSEEFASLSKGRQVSLSAIRFTQAAIGMKQGGNNVSIPVTKSEGSSPVLGTGTKISDCVAPLKRSPLLAAASNLRWKAQCSSPLDPDTYSNRSLQNERRKSTGGISSPEKLEIHSPNIDVGTGKCQRKKPPASPRQRTHSFPFSISLPTRKLKTPYPDQNIRKGKGVLQTAQKLGPFPPSSDQRQDTVCFSKTCQGQSSLNPRRTRVDLEDSVELQCQKGFDGSKCPSREGCGPLKGEVLETFMQAPVKFPANNNGEGVPWGHGSPGSFQDRSLMQISTSPAPCWEMEMFPGQSCAQKEGLSSANFECLSFKYSNKRDSFPAMEERKISNSSVYCNPLHILSTAIESISELPVKENELKMCLKERFDTSNEQKNSCKIISSGHHPTAQNFNAAKSCSPPPKT